MRFVHVGFENIVPDDQVLFIMRYGTQSSKRLLSNAKMTATYLDATSRKQVRSLIILANGYVVGCTLSAKTLMARFNAPDVQEDFDEEPEDEEEEYI